MSWDWLPSWPAYLCTFLTWAIPWGIYKFNRWLHRTGDPGWKTSNCPSDTDRNDPSRQWQ